MTDILAITLFYPPHHLGGYEIACQSALGALAERGHRVRVLTSDLRLDHAGADAPGVVVDRSLRSYVDRSTLLRPSVRARWRIERHNQAVLRAALAERRPDVVSVWHMGAMSHGLLTAVVGADLPAVAVIADDWLRYGVGSDPWADLFDGGGRTRPVRRAVGRAVRPVVGVPTTVADFGAHAGFLFTSADNQARAGAGGRWSFPRAAISYLGIDEAPFRAARAKVGPDATDAAGSTDASAVRTLLYAGRCDPRKGIATVIDALADLPGVTLELRTPDGDEAHGDDLRARAAATGVADRVTWAPALPQAALAERIAAADAIVFPSTWPEPFGLVPIEAMAAGTPVVATGVGGSGEFLVDGANCVRFTPGDASSLVDAIHRLGADTTLAGRLVRGGDATAAFFARDRFADVVEAWHDAAASGWPEPLPAGRHFDRTSI